MQAMRNGTPVKAAAVLGLPGTMITSGEPFATPTKQRNTRKTRGETGDDTAHDLIRDTRLDTLASRNGRSISDAGAMNSW